MTCNSQKVFDEVGYNLSEEVKALIMSLDGTEVEVRDRQAGAELADAKEKIRELEEALAEKQEENASLKEQVDGLERTIGLLRDEAQSTPEDA